MYCRYILTFVIHLYIGIHSTKKVEYPCALIEREDNNTPTTLCLDPILEFIHTKNATKQIEKTRQTLRIPAFVYSYTSPRF